MLIGIWLEMHTPMVGEVTRSFWNYKRRMSRRFAYAAEVVSGRMPTHLRSIY